MALKYITIRAIRVYKNLFSRSMGFNCRFYPSCSCYAIEALENESFFKAGVKIIWRILRCNPFSVGGYDPVKR